MPKAFTPRGFPRPIEYEELQLGDLVQSVEIGIWGIVCAWKDSQMKDWAVAAVSADPKMIEEPIFLAKLGRVARLDGTVIARPRGLARPSYYQTVSHSVLGVSGAGTYLRNLGLTVDLGTGEIGSVAEPPLLYAEWELVWQDGEDERVLVRLGQSD